MYKALMSRCAYCHSTKQQIRSGLNASGSQRFRCRGCDRIYTPAPSPNGYAEDVRRQAVRLYLEGMNLRRIGRILSVNHQSVTNWVNAYHDRLPAARAPVAKPGTLEMDELFTFVGSKKRKPMSSR
jgi:transposase-like protein